MGILQSILGKKKPVAAEPAATLPARPARAPRAGEPLDDEGLDDLARWTLFSAKFTPGQSREYEAYGADVIAATLAYHDGDFESALKAFEALVARHPDAQYLWQDVGRARYAAHDAAGAAAAFERFLGAVDAELGCDARIEAYVELARAHDELGAEESAIEALSRCVDGCDDSSPKAYVVLGNYLRIKGHAKEAIEVLEPAVALEACCSGGTCGKSNDAQRELGLARAMAGQYDGALELLEPIARKAQALPFEFGLLLARAYAGLGSTDSALATLDRIAKLPPAQRDVVERTRAAIQAGQAFELTTAPKPEAAAAAGPVHVMSFTLGG